MTLFVYSANYVVAVDGGVIFDFYAKQLTYFLLVFELVFGTSCSAPVTGAILTLINDARLAIGKKPIGKKRDSCSSSAAN